LVVCLCGAGKKMSLIDIVKEGLEKENKNGNSSYMILILGLMSSAIWFSYALVHEDIDSINDKITVIEEKTNVLITEVAVIKAGLP